MSVESVIDDYNGLSAEQKTEFANSVFGKPSKWVTNVLWILVMLILGGVIFVGGWYGITKTGSDETALYGFVGTALGAIVGVLAPSPIEKK
jgi:hypothetical protein